jgi:hypothetical protein
MADGAAHEVRFGMRVDLPIHCHCPVAAMPR